MAQAQPAADGADPPDARRAEPSEPPDPRQAAVIDARLAELTARFGDRWQDTQRARIREHLARDVDLAARLRQTPLANADEPEIVFVPYRGEG